MFSDFVFLLSFNLSASRPIL